MAYHSWVTPRVRGSILAVAFFLIILRVSVADIGDPTSKASGRLFKGITERLREAGFEGVKTSAKAYGIVATARGNGR